MSQCLRNPFVSPQFCSSQLAACEPCYRIRTSPPHLRYSTYDNPDILRQKLYIPLHTSTCLYIALHTSTYLYIPPTHQAALNIQRGRDHALPDYTTMRQLYGQRGQTPYRPTCPQRLLRAYRSFNDIDLFSAGMCEAPKRFSLVGPLFTDIIADQFERLRDGDRYWFTNLTRDFPELRRYNRAAAIQRGSVDMRDIILRNTNISPNDLPAGRSVFIANNFPKKLPKTLSLAKEGRIATLFEAVVEENSRVAGLNRDD